MILLEDEDGPLGCFMGSSTSSPVHAHVGDIVSTHELIQGGSGSVRYTTILTFTGQVDMTTVGHNLAPPPKESGQSKDSGATDDALTEYSLAFSVDCDKPVRARLSGHSHVYFITTMHEESGVGPWAHLVGHTLLGAHAHPEYTVPDVRFRVFDGYSQALSIILDHPKGQSQSFSGPEEDDNQFRHDGGPGSYGLLLNRLALLDGMWFWSFLAGVHEIEHLDQIAHLPGPEEPL